jgi:hypothetical protein
MVGNLVLAEVEDRERSGGLFFPQFLVSFLLLNSRLLLYCLSIIHYHLGVLVLFNEIEGKEG